MNREIMIRRGKSPEAVKLLLEAGDRLIDEQEFSRLTGWKRRTIQQRRYLGRDALYVKLSSGAVRYLFSEVCSLIADASVQE